MLLCENLLVLNTNKQWKKWTFAISIKQFHRPMGTNQPAFSKKMDIILKYDQSCLDAKQWLVLMLV